MRWQQLFGESAPAVREDERVDADMSVTDPAGGMRLEFDIRPDDLMAFARYTALESPRARRRILQWRLVAAVAFTLPWLAGFALEPGPRYPFIWPVIMAAVAVPAWFAPLVILKRAVQIRTDTDVLHAGTAGHWTMAVGGDGLTYSYPAGRGQTYWSAVEKLESSSEAVYVFIQPLRAYVVPLRAFASADEAGAFIAYCKERTESSRARHGSS